MYRIIEAHLVLSGTTKREIAESLGVSYNTLLLKLKGSTSFTLDEAVRLRDLLQIPESVEAIFERVTVSCQRTG